MQDLSSRKEIVILVFITVAIIFLIRLFYIQVIDDSYKLSAENNVMRYVTEYPARGLIYDRTGKVMVYNQPAYDLMVIPRHVKKLDTIDFCNLIDITKAEFIEKLIAAKKYSYYKPSIFQEQLNSETYAALQEKMYKFDGFLVYNRSLRKYPYNAAASLLGYINEVSGKIIEKDSYYSSGDYIGASGIEKSYEKQLRGKKGVKVFMVDVFNRVKSSFRDGIYDTLPESGTNLNSTIDIELQQLGEKLMQNKKGSLVAIEPSTGEILAMVTSPSYDPNLLVGRVRSENYVKLQKDTLVPLFNRALMAQYPPGSIFKIVQALIAMQEKAITPQTMFTCNKRLINCHNHPFPLDVFGSIQHSCNPYYYMVFKRILNPGKSPNVFIDTEMGFATWREHIGNFGLGERLGVDILSEKGGNIPTIEYYDKIYGRRHWKFETVYSLGIGQGEILVVPLQMANLAAIFANRGYYITPHIIRNKNKSEGDNIHYTKIEKKYFDLVADAMAKVVENGTARRAQIDSITVCGKTGTAENPHGEDHSVFIAFAPRYNPKIAVSVYVENSGFGGTWAAPIASLIIEKYLTRELKNQRKLDRILEADFIHNAIRTN